MEAFAVTSMIMVTFSLASAFAPWGNDGNIAMIILAVARFGNSLLYKTLITCLPSRSNQAILPSSFLTKNGTKNNFFHPLPQVLVLVLVVAIPYLLPNLQKEEGIVQLVTKTSKLDLTHFSRCVCVFN
jgi:hypothetical protein